MHKILIYHWILKIVYNNTKGNFKKVYYICLIIHSKHFLLYLYHKSDTSIEISI